MKDAKEISFELTKKVEKLPLWLKDQARLGKFKLEKNEDDEIKGAIVASGSKTYYANVGDVIMATRHGMVVKRKEVKMNE